MTFIKPRPLRRGDTIGVVVPAGPVDRERIDRAFSRVRELGFELKTYGDVYRRSGYLAGDDVTRATELMAAFDDTDTVAVWCARGGYGVARLLDKIDFDVFRLNPKVFIGFSDITALHLAFQQRSGLITFHGPNLQDGFGKPAQMPEPNAAALWHLVGAEEPVGSMNYAYALQDELGVELRTIAGGVATGPITGGNLAVLCGLMGTPFEVETERRILFLEDVSERAYRIDRYLVQLGLAGKLQAAAGILLGSFSYDDDEPADTPATVAAVLDEFCGPLGIPVLAGFPAGHAQYNLTLPMGALVRMDADAQTLQLLECPVTA